MKEFLSNLLPSSLAVFLLLIDICRLIQLMFITKNKSYINNLFQSAGNSGQATFIN